ncbi:ABC transporter permease subunit [Miniphocaeibacter sp.]|uniref:ABC transporter permease subunit n=1 Tax=Miniphocaeibacter sp. TaxID=3100973 RepID=UPI003BAFBB2B
MKTVVFNLELKNKYKSLVVWIMVLSILIFAILAILPSMETESMQSLVDAKLEGIPDGLLVALGIEKIPDFTNPSVCYGYIYLYINMAIVIFASLLVANALVEEESSGKIEYLYGQSLSRKKIFVEKLLASMALLLILLVLITAVAMMSLKTFKSHQYTIREINESLFRFFLGSLFTNFIFIAFGILLSSLLKILKSITSFIMAFVFGTYIVGIIGELVGKYDFLNKLSPLKIMNPLDIMEQFPSWKIVVPWLGSP